MTTSISRRTALAAGLTGAGALALAACGSSGGDGDPSVAKNPPADTGSSSASSPTSPSSPASSAAGSSGSGDSGSSSALATLDDIAVGEAVSAKIAGKPVLVARPTDSTAACFSAICTHEGCTVGPAGKELHCPCHGSVFNASTGAVISGPAPRALDKIAVKVDDGKVVADA